MVSIDVTGSKKFKVRGKFERAGSNPRGGCRRSPGGSLLQFSTHQTYYFSNISQHDSISQHCTSPGAHYVTILGEEKTCLTYLMFFPIFASKSAKCPVFNVFDVFTYFSLSSIFWSVSNLTYLAYLRI